MVLPRPLWVSLWQLALDLEFPQRPWIFWRNTSTSPRFKHSNNATKSILNKSGQCLMLHLKLLWLKSHIASGPWCNVIRSPINSIPIESSWAPVAIQRFFFFIDRRVVNGWPEECLAADCWNILITCRHPLFPHFHQRKPTFHGTSDRC